MCDPVGVSPHVKRKEMVTNEHCSNMLPVNSLSLVRPDSVHVQVPHPAALVADGWMRDETADC